MDEWKKPPPKFTRKKKKTSKIASLYLIFILISILTLAAILAAVKWLNLNPIFGVIVFIIVFISSGIVGLIIHVFFIKELIDEVDKKT